MHLKIGGVPEHFNYPWYLTLKNKAYTAFNTSLRWTDYHSGTGAMCKALREGSVDIAIVLTEGIVKDISLGNPSKIVQTYVESPLIWGIHVHASSSYKTMADLEHAIIAISRFGSGSHLMALVNAHAQGWDPQKLQFKVVDNLQGGIDALEDGSAAYFMWEHFTTKPYVDNGTFRHIGDCPSPWPCFVIAVRNEILEKHPVTVQKILATINAVTTGFKDRSNIAQILATRYEQKEADIKQWLSLTHWNTGQPICKNQISNIQKSLLKFHVIDALQKPSLFIKK